MEIYIHRFALWLLSLLGEQPVIVPKLDSELLLMAKTLCAGADARYPGTAGEWKRDRVYEHLLNTYPRVPPKHLYLAIMLARFS